VHACGEDGLRRGQMGIENGKWKRKGGRRKRCTARYC
jgi:hypothetical protein